MYPSIFSKAGTKVSMFDASQTPPITPNKIPIAPIIVPCIINIFKILFGLAPSVLNTAISDCLSDTAITSVDIILNAATATINVNITNITVFSVFNARKKFECRCVQSITQYLLDN